MDDASTTPSDSTAKHAPSRERLEHQGNWLFRWRSVLPLLAVPVVAVAVAFLLYYERIIFAEEEFLRRQFGDRYLRWASRTPMFVPRLSSWQAPERAFDWKRTVRKEYQSLFALIAAFTALEVASDLVARSDSVVDPVWLTLFLAAAVLWIALRLVVKHTRLLHASR